MAEVFQYMPQKKFFFTLFHIFKSEQWCGWNGQVNDIFKREYFLRKYFLCKGKFDVGIVRSAGAASGQHRSHSGLRAEKVKSLKLFYLRKLSGI